MNREEYMCQEERRFGMRWLERERERKEDKAKINVDEEGRKGKYKKRR